MPGILGGLATGAALKGLEAPVRTRPWYGTERAEAGDFGLALVHHGDRDPGGRTWWTGGRRAGAIHGAVTNRTVLGDRPADRFGALLDRPESALPAMDGPFVAAAFDADADRAVVATDKLGSRPCYYTTAGGFAVAPTVRALLPRVDDPTPDRAAVADMLLMGHVWGDKTLLQEVRRLPPASFLEYDGGTVRTRRYWSPDYGERAPTQAYLDALADRYRSAVTAMARTVSGPMGLWLSGGLDSRSMGAVLADAVGGGREASPGRDGSSGREVVPGRDVAADGGARVTGSGDAGIGGDGGTRRTPDGGAGFTTDGGAQVARPATRPADGDGTGGLVAYTYRANPPGGVNPTIAGRVADALDLDHREVAHGPDLVDEHFEEAVAATDGMLRWSSMANMFSVFALPDDRPGVVVEAAGQGELLGEHLLRYHYRQFDSVAEAVAHRQAALDPATVRELLGSGVDPLASLRVAEDRARGGTHAERLRDAHLRNHYARFVFASNPVARSHVGLRTPFADGAFLRHVARLPVAFRMGAVPLTRGRVPLGASKPKLALVRALSPDLAAIPYERTRVAPSRPYPAHVAGFAATTLSRRLAARLGGRSWGKAARWCRDHPGLRERATDLLDAAGARSLLDADAVERLRSEHLGGEADHVSAVTSLMAVESWLRRFVDGS